MELDKKTQIITLAPYSQQWSQYFEEEAKRLEEVFANICIAFYHIGSTSIPGCSAKPRIDILGVTSDITLVDDFNEAMIQMGYCPHGEGGMKQRRFFTRDTVFPVNLHIFEDSDPEVSRHLRFRDYLRGNPDIINEYSELKQKLSEKYPQNLYQYNLGKNDFIKKIDCQAAVIDDGRYLKTLNVERKKTWTQAEIVSSMEANMHLHMTYFAKYVPNIEIVFEPDVTVVSSDIADDSFNYVIGANFSEENVKERVDHVVRHYRNKGVPFSWWVGERDAPVTLGNELIEAGLELKEDDLGMYLPLDQYDNELEPSDILIRRAVDEHALRSFAKVFADLGGAGNLYDVLYRNLPITLIADGGPYEMYIGYLDGVPVITAILVLHANVGGIYYVMTSPEHRRRGFGTHMMKYLVNRVKEKGYHMVTLQASAKGRGLYERLGFQPICRFVEYA